ncbi:RING finger and SPRY domain-containing protein 1 [Entomortierella beljakovae]|nr:RING finger and SPRY domain-containing protein 1 [Entomortierella beljakovae]
MAALPSQQTTKKLSQQLLSKCDSGSGLVRLRSKKKNKPAAALIWSVLANRLAGEMCSTLFSNEVCECLLNNIENDPDMTCKVFSIIALEKFSLTGPCKARILQTNIRQLLVETANLPIDASIQSQEEISGILQAKFCAEWSIRNIFRDMPEGGESIDSVNAQGPGDLTPAAAETGLEPKGDDDAKLSELKPTNVNVMLNTLDATRHWKISEDGLTIRNDGTTFESIRATACVTQGKWLYEVTLVTAGIMQLGWATVHCHFSPEDGTGIGDDIFGFAYDGCRNLIWADGESESYGGTESWKPGDVLGVYLDVDNAKVECFINGQSLGVISPFEKDHFAIQAKSGFFPALSCTSFQQATVNFGATPFKYPPSLPWRNLNDYGTISLETRRAIVRPRNDSVYGRIQVDPLTGIRLPSMPEGEAEIDYSLLCTICCDHTATVTLQPCGHDGLCVECAYSLDMCPLCRSKIFQRQMFQNNDSEDASSSSGLGISGIASDASSANTSLPGLSTSTSTSTWSAEYCGPPQPSPLESNPVKANPDTLSSTAAAAAVVAATANIRSNSSESLTTRRRNTLAASSPSSRVALEIDCLSDPFSPPSTAYFSFLNRPRTQRSQLNNPVDMDSVDPLELPIRRSRFSQPIPLPVQHEIENGVEGATAESRLGLGLNMDMMSSNDYTTESTMDIEDSDVEDSNGMDVVLVEEGREASDSEVMEHSVMDFPDGHSIHSRRSSIQVVSLPHMSGGGPVPSSSTSTSIATAAALNTALSNIGSTSSSSNSIMSNASGLPPVPTTSGMGMGVGSGTGTSRFNGRRASVPCNRLEM